jgi:5-carboxymethyl-2-hydroxymuconate isomerase
MPQLCRALADTMLAVRDDDGQQVFPTGGTRVLAYPAPHFAVADGGAAGRAAGDGKTGIATSDPGEYGFMYLNLRMGRGRSDATQKRAGDALSDCVRALLDAEMATRHIGLTVQVDVGPEVFDAKHSSLHPLFRKPRPC